MEKLTQLRQSLAKFSKERDWDKFHTPKNLASALSVEAAELLEIFQWLTDEESRASPSNGAIKSQVEEELADIFMYLIQLANKMEIDLYEAAFKKLKLNTKKYPVGKVKGTAKKYSEV